VRVRNPVPRPTRVEWTWVLPYGWEARPAAGSVRVAENGEAKSPFEISIPPTFSFQHPKRAIALDVVHDGKAVGQISEAVVENRPYGAAGAQRPISAM